MSPRSCKSILGISRTAAKFTRSIRLERDPVESRLIFPISTTTFFPFFVPADHLFYSFLFFLIGGKRVVKLICRFCNRFWRLKNSQFETRENMLVKKLDPPCTLAFSILFCIFIVKTCSWRVVGWLFFLVFDKSEINAWFLYRCYRWRNEIFFFFFLEDRNNFINRKLRKYLYRSVENWEKLLSCFILLVSRKMNVSDKWSLPSLTTFTPTRCTRILTCTWSFLIASFR